METFGQKLRQAVELSGLGLEDVARATRLDPDQIRALERDDFAALPNDSSVREGLRAFARLIEVDPDQVIADYSRERQRWTADATIPMEEVGARDAVRAPRRAEPSRPRAGRGLRIAVPVLALAAVAIAAFLFRPRASTAPEPVPPAGIQQRLTPVEPEAVARPVEPNPPADTEVSAPASPPTPEEPVEPAPAIARPPRGLGPSIHEHGVGRRILDHELVDEADRFTEGERVIFWTRVEGGTPGESIHHVWIHEGEEVRDVPIRLGAARWRAHSYKTLSPGSAGNWAVEARDSAGRVLARRELVCAP